MGFESRLLLINSPKPITLVSLIFSGVQKYFLHLLKCIALSEFPFLRKGKSIRMVHLNLYIKTHPPKEDRQLMSVNLRFILLSLE